MTFGFLRSLSGNFDLIRIGGASALVIYPSPYLWNVFWLHNPPPDPSTFGLGYAAVIGAVAAAIGGKEIALAKANATNATTAATP
jgi:hypothetical protein